MIDAPHGKPTDFVLLLLTLVIKRKVIVLLLAILEVVILWLLESSCVNADPRYDKLAKL